jgi:hypothetical protein
MPDTKQLAEIIPGFKDLPVAERMLVEAYKSKPEVMAVYQATKTLQLHDKFEKQCIKCNKRFDSLETTRSRIKWYFGGALAVLMVVKAYILARITNLLG